MIKFFKFFLLTVFLASCYTVQLYGGPQKNKDEIAIISLNAGPQVNLRQYKFNGDLHQVMWLGTPELNVSPGEHNISVYYQAEWERCFPFPDSCTKSFTWGLCNVKMKVEKGKSYRLSLVKEYCPHVATNRSTCNRLSHSKSFRNIIAQSNISGKGFLSVTPSSEITNHINSCREAGFRFSNPYGLF